MHLRERERKKFWKFDFFSTQRQKMYLFFVSLIVSKIERVNRKGLPCLLWISRLQWTSQKSFVRLMFVMAKSFLRIFARKINDNNHVNAISIRFSVWCVYNKYYVHILVICQMQNVTVNAMAVVGSTVDRFDRLCCLPSFAMVETIWKLVQMWIVAIVSCIWDGHDDDSDDRRWPLMNVIGFLSKLDEYCACNNWNCRRWLQT